MKTPLTEVNEKDGVYTVVEYMIDTDDSPREEVSRKEYRLATDEEVTLNEQAPIEGGFTTYDPDTFAPILLVEAK